MLVGEIMKKYRCPWCGDKGAKKNFHLLFDTYRMYNRFGEKCTKCNKYYRTVPAKKRLIYDIGIVLVFLFFVALSFLHFILRKNVVVLLIVLATFYLVANVFIVINAYCLSVLHRSGENVQIIETQFLAQLDKPLNLNCENIFTMRLKEISPQKIMAKSDLLSEYNQDGAPIYVEHQDNSDYRIGLLNPIYYNLEVFALDTDFEVYDTEGEVIATGKITKILG